jgi:hypothetical protein
MINELYVMDMNVEISISSAPARPADIRRDLFQSYIS